MSDSVGDSSLRSVNKTIKHFHAKRETFFFLSIMASGGHRQPWSVVASYDHTTFFGIAKASNELSFSL